jgi:hypothetical protein
MSNLPKIALVHGAWADGSCWSDVIGALFGWLPEDDFVGHFAADVEPAKARVMLAVQQPISIPRPSRPEVTPCR